MQKQQALLNGGPFAQQQQSYAGGHILIGNGHYNPTGSPTNLHYSSQFQHQQLILQNQQQQSLSLSPRKVHVLAAPQPLTFTSVGTASTAVTAFTDNSTGSSPSHLDSLRNKSMSLDNTYLGSWGAQTAASSAHLNGGIAESASSLNTKSSSNNNLASSNPFSLNTGFNYMLINPTLYDEEPLGGEDPQIDDAYTIPSV